MTERRNGEPIGADGLTRRERWNLAKRIKRAGGNLHRADFTIYEPPSPDLTAEELIERRLEDFEKKRAYEQGRKLIDISINIKGPIGILHFGDPHLDDDGTDWAAILHDIKLVQTTEGLFAGNIGDTTNNWVGRLAHLYSQQSVTAKQAWTLAEYFIKELKGKWLYHVLGNHDCHDEETECLTNEGWLPGSQVTTDHQVLSLDPNGYARWSCVTSVVHRHHTGTMVSFESRAINFNVTPNHRLYRKARGTNGWEKNYSFSPASEMPCRVGFAVSGESTNVDEYDIPDAVLTLAGWFLTDGCLWFKGNSPSITFYQSKPGCPVGSLLEGLGLQFKHSVRQRNIPSVCGRGLLKPPLPENSWRMNAESSRYLLGYAPCKGVLPEWSDKLSPRQFQLLLDAIVAGDGCWDGKNPEGKNCCCIHGTYDFLSSVQAAAVQYGWSARISVARRKDYRLNLCKRSMLQFDASKCKSITPYDGDVWCLTVPEGNFMVRRRGAAHFSGNCWSGDGNPLLWICKDIGAFAAQSEARFNLRFPNDREVVLNARHDFSGSSMWNPTHGPMKAVQMGVRDDIAICGHKHKSGYSPLKDPESGKVMHCIQVASYKKYDRYALEKGFRDQSLSPCVLTVIDPDAEDPANLVQVFWDSTRGAEYLTYLRGRR